MRRQHFPLDRLRLVSYIGAWVALAGCHGRLAPLIGLGLEPVGRDQAVAWARATLPGHHRAVRFKWKYRDRTRSWGGRGTARIAPPDSMRFDYAGPLNLGAGAAVVIGDSVVWADRSKDFRSLAPAIPMLWASLGMVQPPAGGAVVLGRVEPPRTFWRFVEGGDTLDYLVTESSPPTLEAEWRREGKLVARSRTRFSDHAMPAGARIDFPEAPARFELTVVAVDTAAVIAPALWRSRR